MTFSDSSIGLVLLVAITEATKCNHPSSFIVVWQFVNKKWYGFLGISRTHGWSLHPGPCCRVHQWVLDLHTGCNGEVWSNNYRYLLQHVFWSAYRLFSIWNTFDLTLLGHPQRIPLWLLRRPNVEMWSFRPALGVINMFSTPVALQTLNPHGTKTSPTSVMFFALFAKHESPFFTVLQVILFLVAIIQPKINFQENIFLDKVKASISNEVWVNIRLDTQLLYDNWTHTHIYITYI